MSRVRTAVVPAAGRGTRLLPATKAVPKALLPVVDKPAIQYVVEEAVACGLDEVVIVTAPGSPVAEHFRCDQPVQQAEAGDPRLDALRRLAERARIRCVTQRRPLGLGHAVALARPLVGREPFAVLLPDVLAPDGGAVLPELLTLFQSAPAPVVALERVPVEEISRHGCAVVRPLSGRVVEITGVVEKPPPDRVPSDLKLSGRYVFGPEVFGVLEELPAGRDGEIQLSDAIAVLADAAPVRGVVAEHPHLDLGSTFGYLSASVLLGLARRDLRRPLRELAAEVVRDAGRWEPRRTPP